MRPARTATTLGAVIWMCAVSVAQVVEPVKNPKAPPKDSHTQAAEELLLTMQTDKMMAQTLDQMLALQIQQQPQLRPFKDVMARFLKKHLAYESVKPALAKLYTTEFTEAEIRELIRFYKTPVGKKAVEKLPKLTAAGAQIGMQRVQANMGELQEMIKQRQAQLEQPGVPDN